MKYQPNYDNDRAMTVADLIATLQQLDPRAQIRIGLEDGDDILTMRGIHTEDNTIQDDRGMQDPDLTVILIPEAAYGPDDGTFDHDEPSQYLPPWHRNDWKPTKAQVEETLANIEVTPVITQWNSQLASSMGSSLDPEDPRLR